MNFMDNLEKEQKKAKTLTENYAVAYETSGDVLLDFNFRITDLRTCSEEEILKAFRKMFFNDKVLGMKYLFYVGDIREGLGERNIFKTCIKWLAYVEPEFTKKVLYLIPEYSRWDILVSLIDVKQVKYVVKRIIHNQLIEDELNYRKGKPISLLAKWMPSENTSSKATRNLARVLMKELEMKPKKYRKTLSKLRAYLDVTEVKMSAKKWGEINYETVPSKANLRYSNAFLKNDAERRYEYLNALKEGKAKINAGVLQPHEIINNYSYNYDRWGECYCKYDETLEQLWKNLKDITTNRTLVVRDGSGSMWTRVTGRVRAVDIATALAIYCSEHTTGEFKDKFVTFSSRPKVVGLEGCATLKDKINRCFAEDDIANTDIYKTMKLVLDTAVHNKMTQEDMPETILIISDMQFDGRYNHYDKTLFEHIRDEYEEAGFKMPRLCFWNLCAYNARTIPLQNNELGLILCSGFSVNNLKMFMNGDIDPLKILLEVVNSERYDKVARALAQ